MVIERYVNFLTPTRLLFFEFALSSTDISVLTILVFMAKRRPSLGREQKQGRQVAPRSRP